VSYRAAPSWAGHAVKVLFLLLVLMAEAPSPGPPQIFQPPVPSGDLAAATGRLARLGISEPAGALSRAAMVRAADQLDRLPATGQSALSRVLTSASPDARPYLIRTLAAGHSVAEVAGLARAVSGRSGEWLRTRLDPLASGLPGPVGYRDVDISQFDDTTCGSTTIVAARTVVDPLYAFRLTTGGRPGTAMDSGDAFEQRLRQAERDIHRRTASWWPESAGTPPWGMATQVNRDGLGLAVRYRWLTVVPALPFSADGVIRRALAAARQGYPVPMLIGGLVPRHYVLLLGQDRAGALVFEPASGEIIRVPSRDLAHRDFGVLGYSHLQAALVPSGPAERSA
jgi:hypothetical protein